MLTMNDTTISAVTKLSQGNPGALNVLAQLAKREHGVLLLLDIDDMGMVGPSIWLGYKDFAKEDIEVFANAVRDRDLEMVKKINASGGKAWSGGRS